MHNLKAESDSFLIESFVSGDQKAIAVLVKRYQSKVYTAANLVVKDRYVAEDILQDTFCKFIIAVREEKYKHLDKLGGYLVRVAHNLAIDYIRRKNIAPTITNYDGEDIFQFLNIREDSALDSEDANDLHARLRKAINQLPDEQREIVLLRYFAQMSFKEIADLTHINLNTALGRMRYGVMNLRKHLIQKEKEYDSKLYPE